MKKIIVIAILTIAMVSLLAAFEGHGRDGREHSRKGMGEHSQMMQGEDGDHHKIAEELELTKEQKEEMEKFRTKHQKEMIDLNAEVKKIMIDKRDAMKDHDFARVRKITKDVFSIKEEIALKRIEQHEKKWDILTPEQKEKAEDLMGSHPRKTKKMRRK